MGEKELDKTSERYRTMFLKYSFAFERKDEYKDCYYRLKAASEKEKARLENQKQKLEERILSWKTKAELEENKRLKLTIDHRLAEQEVEAAEERATELIVELTSIRLKHDTEINDIKKLHDRLIKEEKGKKDLIEKDIAAKDAEIKKQRKVYGGKMDEVRAKLDEAKAEEAVITSKLLASEVTRKELVTKLKLKEKEIIEIKERVDKEECEEIKFWKEETDSLRKKLNAMEKLTTQETSPRETFMGGDDSLFSSTSGSRVQEDLSTTGCLGDTEGMDSIIVHADPDQEDLTSSSDPWPQPKTQKRRRLSNEKDSEENRLSIEA